MSASRAVVRHHWRRRRGGRYIRADDGNVTPPPCRTPKEQETVSENAEVAMRRTAPLVCLILSLGLTRPAHPASAASVIAKARAAIERGDVDPARDLAQLVATLRTARGGG